MIDNKEVYEESLVNHIYFASTIRYFCTIIGLTFYRNNQDYIDRAILLGRRATSVTDLTIKYMNKELAKITTTSGVYITPFTEKVDLLTEKLFGVNMELQIKKDLDILNTRGDVIINNTLMDKINDLNNQALILANDFKAFCLEILDKMNSQKLFSYLYPSFFKYMYEEISVYVRDIERIISQKDYSEFYLREFVYYFNDLLISSTGFIRGLLDTMHQDIYDKLSIYIDAFSDLTMKYLKNNSDTTLFGETKEVVARFKVFLSSIIEELLNSKLYFITPAVTLDNFLTNVNVYIFLLERISSLSVKKK